VKSIPFFVLSVLLMWITGRAGAQSVPVATTVPGEIPSKAIINQRIQRQAARIKADSRVGKLTTVKAADRQAALKSIDDQKKADYVQNGNKDLTDDQKNDLIQKLDQNKQNITNPQYGEMGSPTTAASANSKP